MVLVLLATKDDPKYGPYVDTGLFVDVGLWVGTSLPSDSGDLSGGSDPIPIGYGRGLLHTQRSSGATREHSVGRIKVSIAAVHVQPRSSGHTKILATMPSRILHSARGTVETPRGTAAKEPTAKGYHVISKSTSGNKGHTTSQ